MGNVTVIYPDRDGDREVEQVVMDEIERCFLERHPDAKWWIPGRKPAHTVCGCYASRSCVLSSNFIILRRTGLGSILM
jgi:hypothetical protein